MERPAKLTASRIVGLDLSKKTLVGCILSKEDEFQKTRFFDGRMDQCGREKLLARLNSDDWVIMEGGSSSFNLARYLIRNSIENVYVLNPMQLHIIYESMCKTDRQDAAKIAKYIRDAHPENWCLIPIPSEQESAGRATINMHIQLTAERVRLVNRLHAIFNGQGYPDLKKSDLKIPETRRKHIDELLDSETAASNATIMADQIDFVELQIEAVHEQIRQILLDHPDEARAWLSIPNVGDITAATAIAYLGDMSRFSSASQVRNYIGLLPKRDQSGTVDKALGVKRYGCMPLRRHLVQCAWSFITHPKEVCTIDCYRKQLILRGKKGQKAAVAISNKIVTIAFTLIKNKRLYTLPSSETFINKKLSYYRLEALSLNN